MRKKGFPNKGVKARRSLFDYRRHLLDSLPRHILEAATTLVNMSLSFVHIDVWLGPLGVPARELTRNQQVGSFCQAKRKNAASDMFPKERCTSYMCGRKSLTEIDTNIVDPTYRRSNTRGRFVVSDTGHNMPSEAQDPHHDYLEEPLSPR